MQAAVALRRCRGYRVPVVAAVENPLSEPEFEVALLAAGGASSKEIGEQRFVSPRTVDNQLRSVYKKLGISGRSDLAALINLNVD